MEPTTYVSYILQTRRIFSISLMVCFFALPNLSGAQCIPSTTRSATTIVDDNSVGAISFDNPTNAIASDGSRASADAILSLFGPGSHYLKASNFGFAIPTYSNICGITVEIQKRAGGLLGLGEWVQDREVRIVKGGVVQTAVNYAKAGNWSGSESYHTYGGANDKWGLTAPGALTPADINSNDFGVVISANYNALAIVLPSAQVNHIRITVHYNPVLPTHLVSFTSSLRNNKAHLEWQTADEEDNEFIALQRSVPGHAEWNEIARYTMHSGNSGNRYSYDDVLTEKGNYSYRLRITNTYGQYVYSEIKNIRYTGKAEMSVFPNPAGDFIIIENSEATAGIVIRNLYMQELKVPVQSTGTGSTRVDIRQLPKGIYFASLDGRTIRFVKAAGY
jgi:hypothetical protein